MQAELRAEKADLDKASDDLENASENTWNDVKTSVDKTTRDVEKEWNDFKVSIDKAFDGDRN
jgi:chaperonin cofactor prefoldin